MEQYEFRAELQLRIANHDKRKQHNEPIRTVEAHDRRQVQENWTRVIK